MSKTYSIDLRDRAVATVLEGKSCRAVAGISKVSPSSIIRWVSRYRGTGSVAALPKGGTNPLRLMGQEEWLEQVIAQTPDITLDSLLEKL